MKTTLLSLIDGSGATALNELIARINKLIPVERIYLSQFQYKETSFKELVILFPNSSKLHITEARPLLNMVMADIPEYRFRVFYLHEVKQALLQGSIVFYSICREENLIYQLEGSDHVLLLPNLTAKAVSNKVKRNFEKELKKIGGFREGAAFYMNRQDVVMSTFMLHQVIELSYRAAELLVIGRDKISHSICNHQKFIQQYVPELGLVFNSQDEEEMKLLALLDDAYRAVRYENIYTVNDEQVLFFMSKADLMAKLIAELYKVMVAQFTEQCAIRQEDAVPVIASACSQV